jgi:hypothetical protein
MQPIRMARIAQDADGYEKFSDTTEVVVRSLEECKWENGRVEMR